MKNKPNSDSYIIIIVIACLIFATALLFSSCCEEHEPVLPKITKQSDVVPFTYQEVLDYMAIKKVNLVSAGQIVGTDNFILVFSDGQKCYISIETYDKLF